MPGHRDLATGRTGRTRRPLDAPGAREQQGLVVDVRWPRGDLGRAYWKAFCETGSLEVVTATTTTRATTRAAVTLLRDAPTLVLPVVAEGSAPVALVPPPRSTTVASRRPAASTPRHGAWSRLVAVLRLSRPITPTGSATTTSTSTAPPEVNTG